MDERKPPIKPTDEELRALVENLKDTEGIVERAFMIAALYHRGQTDKAGAEYINHPATVAMKVDGDEAKAAALLHDVLEDTSASVELLETFFPETVVEAVKAVTKKEGEDYFDFIDRISHCPLAVKVKLADLENNMDLSRFDGVDLTENDLRRNEKYKKAHDILSKKKQIYSRMKTKLNLPKPCLLRPFRRVLTE